MAKRSCESFLSPLGPDGHNVDEPHVFNQPKFTTEKSSKLMIPRALSILTPPAKSSCHEMPSNYNEKEDPAMRRKEKKTYYAKLHQQEIGKEKKITEKYRDRAKERREGLNKDYEETELIGTTADYRAVGATAEAARSTAEKRRQLIQESKFLGGDMKHTHLVKGLDFALLQKARSEIAEKEKEHVEKAYKEFERDKGGEDKIEFKTRLGRNIYQILFKNKASKRNELFLAGRMAYEIDLSDDADTDIPTTIIRSKADCPSMEDQIIMTTNDTVISKLTRHLSNLRKGILSRKLKKKDRGKLEENKPPEANMNIFDDVGDYVPSMSKTPRDKEPEQCQEPEHDRKRDRDRDQERNEEPAQETEEERKAEESLDVNKGPGSAKEFIKSINEKFSRSAGTKSIKKPEEKKKLGDFFGISNSYSECYPATVGDAAVDSDEEMEYNKICQANKKGPGRQRDFETQQEYGKYFNSKEVFSRYAPGYDIKMPEGWKPRCSKETSDKAEHVHHPWDISTITDKKKKMEADKVDVKRPKY